MSDTDTQELDNKAVPSEERDDPSVDDEPKHPFSGFAEPKDTSAVADDEPEDAGQEPERESAPEGEEEYEQGPSTLDMDPGLVHQARLVGLRDAEIAVFADAPARLQSLLAQLRPPAETADASRSGADSEAEEEWKDVDLELADEDLDDLSPAVRKALTGALGKVQKQARHHIDRLKARQHELDTWVKASQAQVQQENIRRFDNMIRSRRHEEMLGKGASANLDRNSKEFEKRNQVYDQMATLEAGYMARNAPVPSFERLYDMAVAQVCEGNLKNSARGKLKRKLKNRERQVAGRPSRASDESSTLTPDEKAERFVNRWKKEHGLD